MLTLIDNYDSFTYNLVQFLGELGVTCRVIRNDAARVSDILAAKPQAIILSPGPCTPDMAGICLELVAHAPDTLPIFGVCLGHQAIAQAFGARITNAPEIMHGKLSEVRQSGGALFDGLPQKLAVTRYHSLIIDPDSLPDTLRVDAKSNDGTIMAISHVTRPVFGVQFHPESIASQGGHDILANFLRHAGLSVAAHAPQIPAGL